MSTSQEVETAKKGYAELRRGRPRNGPEPLRRRRRVCLPGNSTVSGTYRGKAELTDMFAKLAGQSLTITPSRFLADGEVVVVLSQITAGGESTPTADAFSFRDGKILEARDFGDLPCLNGSTARSSRGPDPCVFSALESPVRTSARVPFSHPCRSSTPAAEMRRRPCRRLSRGD